MNFLLKKDNFLLSDFLDILIELENFEKSYLGRIENIQIRHINKEDVVNVKLLFSEKLKDSINYMKDYQDRTLVQDILNLFCYQLLPKEDVIDLLKSLDNDANELDVFYKI
jgi:hypothetical protein